jgi:hypothetical protein
MVCLLIQEFPCFVELEGWSRCLQDTNPLCRMLFSKKLSKHGSKSPSSETPTLPLPFMLPDINNLIFMVNFPPGRTNAE